MCLQCPVCLDPLCAGPCFSVDCGHTFHQKCVQDIMNKMPPNSFGQCPCCRTKMTGLRKLYVDPEICTNGIEYHRMKAQSHEYETKQSQQDQIIETMEGDYKELSRKYRKLEADGEEKEHKWRDRLAKVEAENSELRKKTQGAAKKLETNMVAFTQTSPAIVKVQQSGESVSKEKVRKLQKRRIVSRDEYRREKVDRKELEEKLRNQPAAKIRVEPKTEYEATAEDEPRSKRLFRECRKRVGNYKE